MIEAEVRPKAVIYVFSLTNPARGYNLITPT